MKRILKLFILSSLALFYSCDKDNAEQDSYETSFSVPTQVYKINTAAEGYSITVEASDDVSWKAAISTESGNDWVTLVSASGKGNGSVIFDLKTNEGKTSRSMEVTFTASSSSSSTSIPPQKCIISQIGTDPVIEIYPVDAETVPTSANQNYTIDVTSNVEWTALVQITSGSAGWISITDPAGISVTGVGQIKLNILENTNVESRLAVVTVVSTENPALNKTLTITQEGIIPSIVISPTGTASVSASEKSSYKVTTVTSNVEWIASVDIASGDEANWVTIASPTGAHLSNGDILINVKVNDGAGKRTAVLHIKSTAFPTDDDLNKTLTITQINADAMPTIFIADYTALTTGPAMMNISPSSVGAPKAAQDLAVDVTSNATGATIKFSESLHAGNYMINSITYGANPAILVNAIFTTDNVGTVIFVERWDKHFNCFGGNFVDRPVTIDNLADLNILRTAVNAGNNYAGIMFKQTVDIALAGNWVPIGNNASAPFAGIYDGDNHKITNLSISSGTIGALFGNIGGINIDSVAVIKNLTVEGSGATADVTGSSAATVAGVTAVVTANTLIDNCINRANITAPGASNIGGLAGTCTGNNITIKASKNYGKILGATGKNGGIAANLTSTSSENIAITSCHNYGDMDIASAAASVTGGIVGCAVSPVNAEIKWCSNRGNITISVNSTAGTGGIIGTLVGNTVVRECFNLGNIISFTNTGGISGLMNNTAAIYNCYNKGSIRYGTSTAVNNSAIAGNMTNAKARPVEYCYNVGEATTTGTGNKNYGGIAAANSLTNYTDLTGVKECFYEFGKGYAGGIGGNKYPPTDVVGQAEGKTTADMQTTTPYTANWSTSIWQFTAGQYPTLKNNPE
ncbi:BACON domain-containing protein [Dysgonomonas reticulitermitis]